MCSVPPMFMLVINTIIFRVVMMVDVHRALGELRERGEAMRRRMKKIPKVEADKGGT